MTDYMGILRMKSKGFSATAIASSLGVNKRTVLSCIARAAEAGFGYSFPDGTTNGSIREMLYRDPEGWPLALDVNALGQSVMGRAVSNSFFLHVSSEDMRKYYSKKP